MDKIFNYNGIAQDIYFVGRETEIKKLSSDFVFLTNTAILAPQGWGKSSLVRQAAKVAFHKERALRFAYVDLSNVRNEERFYELLVCGVLRSVSSTQKEALDNVGRYFTDFRPRISFGSDSVESLNVDFDWEDIRRNRDHIIDLPCTVAEDKGIKLVVCIEDLHAVSFFSDPETLLQRFGQRWKSHKGVAYCITSSPLSVIERFVSSTPMFFRFGEVMRLGKIATSEMASFIRERFAEAAKFIDIDNATLIAELAENHPQCVQQLAHQSWLVSSVVCSREVIFQAHEILVDQMGLVYDNLTASLTTQQLCYLHAVLAGETVISTSEVLHRHHITSATSASRSKTALLEKGLVCSIDGRISIADPFYASWLRTRYFVKK